MKIQKPDENEKIQNEKSMKYAYLFLNVMLLLWCLVDLFNGKGLIGFQWIILSLGNAIFFGSRLIYKIKMR